MPNQDLLAYVKRQLANGHDPKTVREHLINHGHLPEITDAVLAQLGHRFKKKNGISAKALAFVVLGCVILGGMSGFVLFSANEDLAGAATETTETPKVEVVPNPEPPKELPKEREETDNEKVPDEGNSTNQTTNSTKESQDTVVASGCTSNADCAAGATCYEKSCHGDADKDFLPDDVEEGIGSDPHDQDTDNDGISDYDEFKAGTDPGVLGDPALTACINNNACGEGVCLLSGVCNICEDSDGINYEKQGITKGAFYVSNVFTVSQDTCQDTETVIEYFCRSDGYLYYEKVGCEDVGTGYSCHAGKCS